MDPGEGALKMPSSLSSGTDRVTPPRVGLRGVGLSVMADTSSEWSGERLGAPWLMPGMKAWRGASGARLGEGGPLCG